MPRENLIEFGMIGFHRLNRYNNSKKAFKRTHIYSTVLLNLDKLQGVEYHWRAHAMEDIQFNRDANKHGAVLCKFYRFAFSSPQIKQGGCCYMKACNEELRKGGGATEKLVPVPADAMLQEPSAVAAAPRLPLGGMESVDSVQPFSSPQLTEGGCANMAARSDAPVDQSAPAVQPQTACADWTLDHVCQWARIVFSGDANSEKYASSLANNNMDGKTLRTLCDMEDGVKMELLNQVCSPCPPCVHDCPIRSYRRAVRGYPASARSPRPEIMGCVLRDGCEYRRGCAGQMGFKPVGDRLKMKSAMDELFGGT